MINHFPVDMDIKIYCGIYQVHSAALTVGVMCDRAQLAAEKNRGKYDTLFSYYDDSIRQKLMDEQFITSTMQTALDHGQFHVYYQPKYDLQSEMVAGAEALVRWIHPERGLLSPGVFIPIFEKNGFITQLDRYVWEMACRDIRRWMDLGYPPVSVSVNVSRADIYNPKLAEILQGLLEKYRIPIKYLHLEITESAYTDNSEQIISVVQNLHQIGFIIEMDDFGSGYSSLNMLAEMSVDVLKLDMRFVQSETANTSGKGIMSFVISLAKWMRLSVVAEGVENAGQIATLRSMDCNYVQGFYYAKPMPREDFETILQTSAVTMMKTGDELLTREEENHWGTESAGESEKQSGAQMLIVDDIAINRAVLAEIFADEYVIVEKENGKDAWEYLEKNEKEVEIVLLDLLMPVMDGFQLLKHMRGNGQMTSIPVIVTSQGDAKAEQRALEMGADDFISKPYHPDVVCHRVHNVVGNYHYRNHNQKAPEHPAKNETRIACPEVNVDTIMEQIRYRYILDNLDVAFFERNDKTGEIYASDKCSLYMITDIKNMKKGYGDYNDLIHRDDLPLLLEFFNMKNKKLAKASATLRLKMKDGSFRWTEMMGFYEYDEDGNRVRSTGLLRDVDQEWLQQNKKLQEALNDANRANQAKLDFLARVSHDMRTPLNGILGLTMIMRDKTLDDSLLHDLEQMDQSGKYLLNLINDTLDVSTIEHGRMELHPNVCDGKTAFQNVIALVKPGMDAKGIEFSMQAGDLPFTQLYIDVGRVEQAIMNVLSNAVKFTPEGGKIEFIMENLSRKDGIITDKIIIRDNGIGMSQEFQKNLFEPFAQEHNDNHSIYNGTGLGMTISKQCVELMGGTITVQSEENKGTEVTMILPMPVATVKQIQEHHNMEEGQSRVKLLKGRKILMCEDHPLNAIVVRKLLEKIGIIVEHAENGKQGLDMFRESQVGYYDAVLMDIRMPVMDGLEATRQIRMLDRKDAMRIPIIAMTANAFREDVKSAINAGMSEHLSKPVEPGKLYRTLADFIMSAQAYAGKKVLVVDDVEVNRAAVKASIEDCYEVIEAGNGKRALEILDTHSDLAAVITDIQMPEMDGRELIRRIRADHQFDHIAILANTNYGDYKQEEELLTLGANDFVYKPTSSRVVLMRLRHILHSW